MGGGGETADDVPAVDAHTMNPDVVLATLRRLGGSVEKIFIVGCQPADLRDGMGLTPPVAAAVGGAVELCCPARIRNGRTRRKGGFPMIRRLFASLVLAAVAGLVIKSLPDIARYLKMREM